MNHTKVEYTRIVIEHLNETQPGVLSIMVKDDLEYLKQFVETKVKEAIKIRNRYIENRDLLQEEIDELVNGYLSPAEDLPDETLEELSPLEIERILDLLQ